MARKNGAAGSNAPVAADDKTTAREQAMMHLIAVFDSARSARLEHGLRKAGLSLFQHRALGWIRLSPGCPMSELARGTFIDRTTLTRVVDQLAAAGLIERKSDAKDRRKVLVWPTRTGKRMVTVGDKVIAEINAEVAGVLPPDAVRTMNRGLLILVDTLIADAEVRAVLTGRPVPKVASSAPRRVKQLR